MASLLTFYYIKIELFFSHRAYLQLDSEAYLKQYTVTHRPIARQRLNKHIPRQRVRNNRGYVKQRMCFIFGPTRGYITRSQQ
jgi:hypothetical protein